LAETRHVPSKMFYCEEHHSTFSPRLTAISTAAGRVKKKKKRNASLVLFRVPVQMWRRAVVWEPLLKSLRLSAAVLKFSSDNERVAFLLLRVAGIKALTVVCAYAPNRTGSKFPAFVE